VVTSVETVGGLAKGFRPLRAGQLRFDRSEDGLGDVVLGCENVSDVAIVVDRLQLITGSCIHQFDGDPDPIPGLSNAAIYEVADTEIAGDLRGVAGAPLVAKAGAPGHHAEP
jgi:hypothetical protein